MIYFGTISSQHLILTTHAPIITTVHARSVSFGASLHAPAIHDIVVYPVLSPVLFVIYLFTVASLFSFVYLCKTFVWYTACTLISHTLHNFFFKFSFFFCVTYDGHTTIHFYYMQRFPMTCILCCNL